MPAAGRVVLSVARGFPLGDRLPRRYSGAQVDDLAGVLPSLFEDLGVSGPEWGVEVEGGGDAEGIGIGEAAACLDLHRRRDQRPLRIDDGEAPANRVDVALGGVLAARANA